MVNTTIEYKNPEEEIALPLRGKKSKLSRELFLNYFGKDRCELTDRVIDNVFSSIVTAIPEWKEEIHISFLSEEMKEKYIDLLNSRLVRLGLNP